MLNLIYVIVVMLTGKHVISVICHFCYMSLLKYVKFDICEMFDADREGCHFCYMSMLLYLVIVVCHF
jgi:hypothetical protein